MHDMKELKSLLIDYLYNMVAEDKKTMEELQKEFHLNEDNLEKLLKKFLNRWLQSPELIAMLCEVLGVYPTGPLGETKGQRYYIG